VDGLDVSYVQATGKKWYYDYGDKTLYIVGDCVVSGTNTTGYVNILAAPIPEEEGGAGDALSFTISNLYLRPTTYSRGSPFTVTNGAVTVRLAGANTLDASQTDRYAGLSVTADASLSLTNLEDSTSLTAKGGESAAGIGGGYKGRAGIVSVFGGTVTAIGGEEGGAGIGGGEKGSFEQVVIAGGIVTAYGGEEGGAGIGGGYKGVVGDIRITGGRIFANGGSDSGLFFTDYCGAGIGGGHAATYRNGAAIAISGGTVLASGGRIDSDTYAADVGCGMDPDSGYADYRIVFSGSSTYLSYNRFDESKHDSPIVPVNELGARVFQTEIFGFTPNAKVDLEMSGYGTRDIYANSSGKIQLWLADGVYYYKAGGTRYAMKMDGGTVTTTEIPDEYGVKVDGVDVANIAGDAWNYDPFENVLVLSGDCTVSGTNTYAAMKIYTANNVTVSPSRISIGAGVGDDLLFGMGTLTVTNGTAQLVGNATIPVVVRGGSFSFNGTAAAAFSNATEQVHCVTVEGLKPMSSITFENLPDYYGTSSIFADDTGRVFLWLPNGEYVFAAADEDDAVREYLATVADANVVAADFVRTGFMVNGRDVAFLAGEGWSYDNATITLSGLSNYELSGALTNKLLNIAGTCSIALSNVVFNSFNVYGQNGIVNIGGAFDVTMTIFGENVVTTSVEKIAGIAVPEGASLVIGGEGALTAAAGKYAAGIGGRFDVGCGSITVNGGTVTAFGGTQGAGIGGGSFTGGTSVSGTYGGNIVVNGGVVVATGGDWAAGIGGGEKSSGGSVTVTGGRITAQGGVHGPAIGACGSDGTYGDVTISGGTVVAVTNELTRGIGRGRDTVSMGGVTITGGSVDVAPYNIDPAPSNGVVRLVCVEVPDITPGAAIAFDGLPDGYGTSGIYADADGKVYLWLPEDWDTTPITPHLLSAASGRLGAPSGTSHTFAANGYRYTVTIPEGGGETVAEKAGALQLDGLKIDGFAVEDGLLVINFTASPATWLQGFADKLVIRASETLPIPKDALLDLSGAELRLEGTTRAVFTVPLDAKAQSMFFSVGLDENGK